MTERYVDARELAQVMGVSERTVKRWVSDGIPSETWGMARTRRFLPSQALKWARSRDTIRETTNPLGRRANADKGSNQEVP